MMILPVSENTYSANRVSFFLEMALRKRQLEGLEVGKVRLEPEARRKVLGVSDLAKPPCSLWYSLNGQERDEHDPGTRFGFDTGHVIENYVLDLLETPLENRQKALGWHYAPAPGARIHGHPDGFLDGLIPGSRLVIECKATGGYSFAKKLEEGPDSSHIEQAFCYASALRADFFCIIYTNREAKKSTAFFKVFGYRVNSQKMAKKAVRSLFHARFLPVLMAEKRPAPPLKPAYEFGPRGWRCRPDKTYFARGKKQLQVGYCSYRRSCPEAIGYRKGLEAGKRASA